MVSAIVGGNWGDEGKGKITDLMAKDADIIVRFQGGANAGHTIINEYGKFALHLLPSGVFHTNVTNIIAQGVCLSHHRHFVTDTNFNISVKESLIYYISKNLYDAFNNSLRNTLLLEKM